MKIRVEINESQVKKLILDYLDNVLSVNTLKSEDVIIEVKSKQNYKSEWEVANFRVTYEGDV
jgi:restriction endonuclease Mrr